MYYWLLYRLYQCLQHSSLWHTLFFRHSNQLFGDFTQARLARATGQHLMEVAATDGNTGQPESCHKGHPYVYDNIIIMIHTHTHIIYIYIILKLISRYVSCMMFPRLCKALNGRWFKMEGRLDMIMIHSQPLNDQRWPTKKGFLCAVPIGSPTYRQSWENSDVHDAT